MLQVVLPTFRFALTYSQKLLEGVEDAQMCAQPVADRLINHPAFVIGHLAWTTDQWASMIGATRGVPEEWRERFAPGSPVLPERSWYPAKRELVAAWEGAHGRMVQAAMNASPEVLSGTPPERVQKMFSNMGEVIAGVMSSHTAVHLGQLSAWRRAMGYPTAFSPPPAK